MNKNTLQGQIHHSLCLLVFLCYSYCCKRGSLHLYGTAATNKPIVQPPNDTLCEYRENWRTSEKACHIATLCTANPTWTVLDAKPGCTVRKWLLTAWAMAWPYSPLTLDLHYDKRSMLLSNTNIKSVLLFANAVFCKFSVKLRFIKRTEIILKIAYTGRVPHVTCYLNIQLARI
jgi:hypothetical protein